MDLGKDVQVDFKDGKLMLTALDGKFLMQLEVSALAKPVLEGIKAKVASGEIDLIKGTDLDKSVVEGILDAAIAAVG